MAGCWPCDISTSTADISNIVPTDNGYISCSIASWTGFKPNSGGIV